MRFDIPWISGSIFHGKGLHFTMDRGSKEPLHMVKWSSYPWYFEPLIHGILNPLSMVY
jgi:hypothetical protein